MLAMAGDDCYDWRGQCDQRRVGVVMVVARVWMKDDSPDLASTMKELDRRLQQAEEWLSVCGYLHNHIGKKSKRQGKMTSHRRYRFDNE